jgi:hypothetical protein
MPGIQSGDVVCNECYALVNLRSLGHKGCHFFAEFP